MARTRRKQSQTLDLFSELRPSGSPTAGFEWPAADRFPLNVSGDTVGKTVLAELRESEAPLVVTGYASLDQVIGLIAKCSGKAKVRVLFGNEPFPSHREHFVVGGRTFPEEVQRYWLAKGISLRRSAQLVDCIEALSAGRVEARYLADRDRVLHAKVYATEQSVTLGSSNFTRAGLERNLEANARFTVQKEPKRYRELIQIAENYWSMAADYSVDLKALLQSLLQFVTWQESLARGCAELLEGEWADEYIGRALLPEEVRLWPSQKQGIAQALYVLSRQGSVLVADATGSGKTRLGAHLIRAIQDHIAGSGRLRRGRAVMVCPPAVQENWDAEARLVDTSIETVSHGKLSWAKEGRHEDLTDSLRRGQILCVDEGHNFLNLKSNRTQSLLRNMADHVLVFTATPINRSVVDLLRIVDLLGADNLEEETLNAFKRMLGVQNINRSLTEEELKVLRVEIQKFTVRRTKRTLNDLIRQQPEAYVDRNGRPCRFPRHLSKLYPLHESESDRAIAKQIRELADDLYAVTHFTSELSLPEAYRRRGQTPESYLRMRLRTAKRIARYQIMALLRSSSVALAEHIVGTEQAAEDFGLNGFKKSTETGNVLKRLESLRGKTPKSKLDAELPTWLREPDAHRAACDHDRSIYSQIYQLVRRLSGAREETKVEQLLMLAGKHSLVLAFDRSPITLHAIQQRIAATRPEQGTIVATGDPNSDRDRVLTEFRPGSAAQHLIGLCSDSLSEGVNLQQASCMVHLDMPSVVRIAEQRAGRVDRMDSPHQAIEAWWPEDAPEFALTSDERFLERYSTVETLLGSNMPLPEGMQGESSAPLRATELVETFEEKTDEEPWDGIYDAFEPVRRLIGKDQLVDQATYNHYRDVTARVLSRVSLVRSRKSWAFFCLRGGSFGAPRWLFFPDPVSDPVSGLDDICRLLRRRLDSDVESRKMDADAARRLESFIAQLGAAERSLLPKKKQRALEEMAAVLERYVAEASQQHDQARLERYQALLRMLKTDAAELQPDWDEVASRWLDLIRPVWYSKLKDQRRKPLLLRDIRDDLMAREAEIGPQVIDAFVEFPVLPAPDERISACIIGVP